ncbi:hypothetical protein A2382_04965 [Candidatus Woesebacteria bacterium RIFOXYB1_FULL_38_16]|uniref:Uncharacterized protein n=1 Tax=Candidatus Woesebacteria bacterium RIFOXYB1_FULL_38_16 TaxID=1802538 RepID=A0A1F8CW28_9BACT|nr:MAG: hypothetical protein A2191_00195 [Candidatus Woesebacteria bacterium RIFOXYA1_FULL_38_9]OGM80009.1 MAG: hypothetical protein A2382_04965 [Candidatus Woesebacteria bacterium RIFOXYB1_FULL_38_16]
MKDSFETLVKEAKSILIILPKDPYFDQVASGLSLSLGIKKEKEVVVVCSSPMTVEFNRLVGVDRVTERAGNKNLVINFPGYDPERVERVAYDVIDDKMNIVVVPKPGMFPPVMEQVKLDYVGISADLVILIGGAHERHFPILQDKSLLGAKIVHVGINEISLESVKELISLARPASSISEIVYDFVKPNEGSVEPDLATNLLMGLYEGSKNFTGKSVSQETFRVASELMAAGGKIVPVETRSFPAGAMPTTLVTPGAQPNMPKDWMRAPKVYKGTSIS